MVCVRVMFTWTPSATGFPGMLLTAQLIATHRTTYCYSPHNLLLLTAQPCKKDSFPSWCSPINKRTSLVLKCCQASNYCISFTNNLEEKKEIRSIVGRKLDFGKPKYLGTCPVPFCSPQILREEAKTRTLADAVRRQRLTAWTSISNSKH